MSTELIVRSAQREDTQAWLTLWRGYCAAFDGAVHYKGRLRGVHCLSVTLDTFKVTEPERSEVVAVITSFEPEIVEA